MCVCIGTMKYLHLYTYICIFFVILCKVQFHRVSKVFWYNSKKTLFTYICMFLYKYVYEKHMYNTFLYSCSFTRLLYLYVYVCMLYSCKYYMCILVAKMLKKTLTVTIWFFIYDIFYCTLFLSLLLHLYEFHSYKHTYK